MDPGVLAIVCEVVKDLHEGRNIQVEERMMKANLVLLDERHLC